LINERTAEGRARAIEQGKHVGCKGQDENGLSVNDISKMIHVLRSTIYAKAKEVMEKQ